MTLGHNSGVAAARLKSIVERIENLETQKRDLSSDIKDIYTEAKSAGFDPKIIRALVAERRKDAEEVETLATLLETYRKALAGLADLPLGVAALERVGA